MKNKIIKSISLGILLSSLFSFNAFADENNGFWEFDHTDTTTTTENTMTSNKPEGGFTGNNGDENRSDNITGDSSDGGGWDYDEAADKALNNRHDKPDANSSNNESYTGRGNEWRDGAGKGLTEDNPIVVYGGYSGWGLEGQFTNFNNNPNASVYDISAPFSDNRYKIPRKLQKVTDPDGTERYIQLYTYYIWVNPRAHMEKGYTDRENIDEYVDYWTWNVSLIKKDLNGNVVENIPNYLHGTTPTSKYDFTPSELGDYTVTSIPHQHRIRTIWKDWTSYADVIYNYNGYTERVCSSSGKTPSQDIDESRDRPDLIKTDTFSISANEVSRTITKDYWRWVPGATPKTEAEHDTSLIN